MIEFLRTKPTVDAGVVTDSADESFGWVRVVEYQPGDGYRYRLVFSKLSRSQLAVFGAPPGSQLVTVFLPEGRSVAAIFSKAGFLAVGYVAEKFSLSEDYATAAMLAEVIGHVLMRPTDPAGPSPTQS